MPTEIEGMTLYTVIELSKKFDVSPLTIRNYIKKGDLKGRKFGRKWLVPESALKEYFNNSGTLES
jgi:excisionase family DNA binding protein